MKDKPTKKVGKKQLKIEDSQKSKSQQRQVQSVPNQASLENVLTGNFIGRSLIYIRYKWGIKALISSLFGLCIGIIVGVWLTNKYPVLQIPKLKDSVKLPLSKPETLKAVELKQLDFRILDSPPQLLAAKKAELIAESISLSRVKALQEILVHDIVNSTKTAEVVFEAASGFHRINVWMYRSTRHNSLRCFIPLNRVQSRKSVRFEVPPCESGDSLIAIVSVIGPATLAETKISRTFLYKVENTVYKEGRR